MKKLILAVAVSVLLGTMVFAIVSMWRMTSGLEIHGSILVATILMVVFTMAVGCGLMFLVFYSSRKGIDEDVYHEVAPAPETKDDDRDL